MRVINILADQRQVDDLGQLIIEQSHGIYQVLKKIEQKGVRADEGIQKAPDNNRDNIHVDRGTLAFYATN